jgi:predicted HTH transcriptional regulator
VKRFKVFISSVQSEFALERKELAHYLRHDPLLGTFFEPFLFEEVPATTHSPGKVYLSEVAESDIYIGLIGETYGYEDSEGISPTEREYDQAKSEHLPRWIFIKNLNGIERQLKEMAFIRKIEQDVSRKKFTDIETLKQEVYGSCVLFLKQTGKIESSDFDESLHPNASFNSLDESKIREFIAIARKKRNFPLKETASVERVLKHLKMTREGKLVNSALLAFAPDPQLYFPSSTIKCAHFHGLQVQKPIPDFKEYGGTAFEVADEAVNFILSKLSLSTGTREHSNQVETIYEIPRAVIAEAIINAVAHRDYNSKGSIQVAVFKDRIEICNPGSLPPELDISDLKDPHSSYPHNPLLAGCLFLTGDIERYGTGTVEMYKLLKERGLEPLSISLEEGFKLTVQRPSAGTVHDTIHDTVHDKTGTYAAIAELPHRLVMIIQDEMSRIQLMEILELKNRSHFVKNYLDPSLSEYLIEMVLAGKSKSKHQKYRLTTKGIALKEQLMLPLLAAVKRLPEEISEPVSGEASGEATGEVTQLIKEEIQRVLVALEGEMKRSEIMQKLDLKHDDFFRKQYILPSLDLGYIALTHPDKPNHPNQKYRLTAKGIALKKQLENKLRR